MPRKPINFKLDFMEKNIFSQFTVKQFDDVSFNIEPYNQGEPYDTAGMTGKIFVGVNNDMFMQTTGITVSSNNINVSLDKNMLQKNGRAFAEIELTDSAGTITSSSFIFDIDPKIGEGGMIPGEYEGFVEKYERLIKEFKNEVDSTVNTCNTNVDNKLKNVDSLVNAKLSNFDVEANDKLEDVELRFNTLTASQQQETEVIDARDNEVSLKARLDRDLYINGKSVKQEVIDIASMKGSEDVHYSTDKGYEVCESTNVGIVKDLGLKGRTLVNYSNNMRMSIGGGGTFDGNVITLPESGYVSFLCTDQPLQNKTITVKYFANVVSGNNRLRMTVRYIDALSQVIEITPYDYINEVTFTVPDVEYTRIIVYINNVSSETISQEYKITCIEGFSSPPSYFEGLQSVGEDVDQIEVLSRKEDGNLFDGELELGGYVWENGTDYVATDRMRNKNRFISVTGGKKVVGNVSIGYVFYDLNKNYIGSQQAYNKNPQLLPINCSYINIVTSTEFGVDLNLKVCVSYSEVANDGLLEYQTDKKPILYRDTDDTFKPVPKLMEWDELGDGKYTVASGQVVLDGSESWVSHMSENGYISFMLSGGLFSRNQVVISDKFKGVIWNFASLNDEYIWSFAESCGISILASKLSTQDVAGFKAWLQANPVTVVYQLETPIEYELAPLDLSSYANETLIQCSSGAISPQMNFSITSYITNLITNLKNRVSDLEDELVTETIFNRDAILDHEVRLSLLEGGVV